MSVEVPASQDALYELTFPRAYLGCSDTNWPNWDRGRI